MVFTDEGAAGGSSAGRGAGEEQGARHPSSQQQLHNRGGSWAGAAASSHRVQSGFPSLGEQRLQKLLASVPPQRPRPFLFVYLRLI